MWEDVAQSIFLFSSRRWLKKGEARTFRNQGNHDRGLLQAATPALTPRGALQRDELSTRNENEKKLRKGFSPYFWLDFSLLLFHIYIRTLAWDWKKKRSRSGVSCFIVVFFSGVNTETDFIISCLILTFFFLWCSCKLRINYYLGYLSLFTHLNK